MPPKRDAPNAASEPKEEPKEAKAEPEKPADEPMEEPEVDSEPESDVELDMSGVVEPDNDPPQPMGDPTKEITEADSDAYDAKRSEAMAAFCEGEWDKAVGLFTEAININATTAMPFVKRGCCYLKLKKPNACIRDCDRAVELNPDNAAAHKFRGRAYR